VRFLYAAAQRPAASARAPSHLAAAADGWRRRRPHRIGKAAALPPAAISGIAADAALPPPSLPPPLPDAQSAVVGVDVVGAGGSRRSAAAPLGPPR
jgi:hypothetical protein